jgi:hypothetical protein
MNKILLLLALLLSSCSSTIDHAADRTEEIIHLAKDEVAALKTDILNEVDTKLQVIIPRATAEIGKTLDASIDRFTNSDLVAFMIVAIVCLLGSIGLGMLYIAIRLVIHKIETYRRATQSAQDKAQQ